MERFTRLRVILERRFLEYKDIQIKYGPVKDTKNQIFQAITSSELFCGVVLLLHFMRFWVKFCLQKRSLCNIFDIIHFWIRGKIALKE